MITMLLLVTNSVVFWDVWAVHCHDEGASCGCAKVSVFSVIHFLSSISKCHSKSQELTVLLEGAHSQ
jgi:hypothetical protein